MKTKTIRMQFRVDKNQYERILNLSKAKGFYHIADYVRYAVLEKDLSFERKFEEVHQVILSLVKKLK